MSPAEKERISFLLLIRVHCLCFVSVTFWEICICAVSWLSWFFLILFFFTFVHIFHLDILVPTENLRGYSRFISVVLMFFSFPLWCNIIMTNYAPTCRRKIYYIPLFSLALLCTIFHHLLSPAVCYFTETVLYEITLLSLTCPWQFVDISITLLTLKGVPEWLCPTFGASAVLWGGHLFSKCLREHCTSYFCPVQQGKYPKRSPIMKLLWSSLLVNSFFLINQFPSLNDQESCVRVLLYRGANKEAKNKHGQTPFQVHA